MWPGAVDMAAGMGELMRLNVGKRFGVHVRTLRHARQLTQEELAERSDALGGRRSPHRARRVLSRHWRR